MTVPIAERRQEVIRNFAVEIVDGIRGFTMEFAGSPGEHRLMYDHIETRVTELAAALDAQSAERTRAEVEALTRRRDELYDALKDIEGSIRRVFGRGS